MSKTSQPRGRPSPFQGKIDRVSTDHCGLADEEMDCIINYDILYSMGWEG